MELEHWTTELELRVERRTDQLATLFELDFIHLVDKRATIG